MHKRKRAKLEAHGWRVGSAAEFLELTPEEAAFVELKLVLSQSLRERRTAQHLSQAALAKRLHSSQSRVAKMEAADPTVSVDLLLRALFALGATSRDIAAALRRRPESTSGPSLKHETRSVRRPEMKWELSASCRSGTRSQE